MKRKHTRLNKVLLTAFLAGLLSSVSSAGLEPHTFYNTDKSKSFKGTLMSVDDEKQQVRVRTSKGRDLTVKLSALSEDCKEYVAENSDKVSVASALQIDFKLIKGEKNKATDSTENSFELAFHNKGNSILGDVVVDYTIYYKKGNMTKEKTEQKTATGSFNISELDPNYRTTETTTSIDIIRKRIKGKGGSVSSGGGGG